MIWARLSSLSFGVYLFHPIVLDLLEKLEIGDNLFKGFRCHRMLLLARPMT